MIYLIKIGTIILCLLIVFEIFIFIKNKKNGGNKNIYACKKNCIEYIKIMCYLGIMYIGIKLIKELDHIDNAISLLK